MNGRDLLHGRRVFLRKDVTPLVQYTWGLRTMIICADYSEAVKADVVEAESRRTGRAVARISEELGHPLITLYKWGRRGG